MPVSAGSEIRPLDYRVFANGAEQVIDSGPRSDLIRRVQELEREIDQREKEHARQVEAARIKAREDSQKTADQEAAAWRERWAGELAGVLNEFRAQKDDYFARVEHEVVRLALAIAERILHREAQMDPLLLSGAVRVALGQLSDSSKVRLRVPSEHKDLWTEMLRLMPGLPLQPLVVADPEMQGSEAVLETELGSVDLGVRAQIAEIERGFFDLLDVRRSVAGGNSVAGKRE